MAGLLSRVAEFLLTLEEDNPRTGRQIDEDGNAFNIAEHHRISPINIARGYHPGYSPFGSFGVRTSTGAESNYPVWPNGAFKLLPISGAQMTIVSTSANDTVDGTHARELEIHYLDSGLNPQKEVIALAGLTPVLTVATDIRFIQCMHVEAVGSADTAFAAGTITAKFGADTYSIIAAGDTRCTSSFRMVPKDKVCFVDAAVGGSVSATSDANTTLFLVASELDNHQYVDPLILIPHGATTVQNTSIPFNFPPGPPFREGTVIGMLHTTDKAARISATWYGRLEPVESLGALYDDYFRPAT